MHIFSTAHPACDHSKSVNSFLQSTHLTELNRERALGGSRRGVKRSWREALIMPPASRLTELLTRERVILQDRISSSLLPWETRITYGKNLWSRFSTERKPRSLPWRSFLLGRRVALPQCSLMKNLHWIWSKGRLGLRTSGRMEGLHLGARKNLPK